MEYFLKTPNQLRSPLKKPQLCLHPHRRQNLNIYHNIIIIIKMLRGKNYGQIRTH